MVTTKHLDEEIVKFITHFCNKDYIFLLNLLVVLDNTRSLRMQFFKYFTFVHLIKFLDTFRVPLLLENLSDLKFFEIFWPDFAYIFPMARPTFHFFFKMPNSKLGQSKVLQYFLILVSFATLISIV